MSAINTRCPTDTVLSDFGLGKLDAAQGDTISKHLETCADCRQRVASLSGDSFVGRLRQADDVAKSSVGRARTYVPGESLTNAANSTDGSSGEEDGLPRPSRSIAGSISQDGPGGPSSVSAPAELADHPDYELIKELGQGGMGTVYLAKNRMMDRPEVLKVVNQALLARPGALERFQQEIRSAAKLGHPNIVAAYSVLRPGDLLVFAMEYVRGHDLSQVVKQRGPLPVANAAFYIHQVANGLQHAFEKGMVHRDIKPNNLMLAIEGKKHIVKILDFGLAKATSEKGAETGLTKSGQMLGTPDYVAPEQSLDAHNADIRADIYSLGCTLYFLLSGRPPFEETSLYAILEAHHKREPKPLNLLRPAVPVELATVVSTMMAKDPAKRYQTPIEVAKALVPFFKPRRTASTGTSLDAPDSPEPREAVHHSGAATPVAPLTPPPMPCPAPVAAAPTMPIATSEPADLLGPSIETNCPALNRNTGWWRSLPLRRRWALGITPAAFAFVCGVILLLPVKGGVIKIEINDPQIAVAIKGTNILLEQKDNGREITVSPGEQTLIVKRGDFNFETDKLILKKGNAVQVTVTLLAGHIEVKEGERVIGHEAIAPAPAKLFPAFLVRGDWKIEDDELVQPKLTAGYLIDEEVPRILPSFPLISFGDESLSSYDLTLDVKKTGGRDKIGILFHWFRPGHCQSFWLEQNRLMNFSWFEDGILTKKKAEWKDWNYSSNRWYALKLEVRGNTYRVYLDNDFQFERTDDQFTHGRICVFTQNATARFRRIKVKDPQGNVLFEGLPQLPAAGNDKGLKPNFTNTPRPFTAEEAAANSEQEDYAQKHKLPVISTNSIGMKLALIPPGEFQMGVPGQQDNNAREHHVKITKHYYLGIYEVTQREFETILRRNPSFFQNSGGQSEQATGIDTSQYPVDAVTWFDAVEFCNKLSEKEDRQPYYHIDDIQRDPNGQIKQANVTIQGGDAYRLPTEAEWEYSCRAGTTSRFNFGMANNGTECNCNGNLPEGTNTKGPWLGQPIPVGSYRPNAFGLYDMHGNACEWCWDAFDKDYYGQSPLSDPMGPDMAKNRVYRGGVYCYDALYCGSAIRMSLPPEYTAPGFRIACNMGSALSATGNAQPPARGTKPVRTEERMAQIPLPAVQKVGPLTQLFNLTDFAGWNKYVARSDHSKDPTVNKDPEGVFKITDGMIRVSGQRWGTLTTKEQFDNYHLTVEFKWGKQNWEPQNRARTSGLLLHAVPGSAHDPWSPQSIRCAIFEGATGDLECYQGKEAKTPTSFAVEAVPVINRAGQAVLSFKPGAPLSTITKGFVRRLHLTSQPPWRDVAGFHREGDVEKPPGEWNTLDIYCLGDQITIVLNGTVVNRASQAQPTRGRISLQSHGAEIFFRKVDLQKIAAS